MSLIQQLIQVDKKADTPIYLQISNSFIQNIRKGRLRSGIKLPGTRGLAGLLNIHRKTAVAAYNELMAQNWIEMIPRKGTYVAMSIPDIKPVRLKKDEVLDRYPSKTLFTLSEGAPVHLPMRTTSAGTTLVINDGFPDVRLAPTDLLFREMKSLASRPAYKKYFQYGNAAGTSILRETLAGFLGDTRGLPVKAENIMITQGAQMGIFLSASLLIKPGDNIIVGEPGYFAATHCFQYHGAIINRVTVDDKGIDVDSIEALCKKKKIRAIYVIPHHHHPTTVTLIPERRIRLLQLAALYKFAIIEDDYDYDFHYNSNPILPLASLDHSGNVIYIGTLTKTLVPSIRVGFIVAPQNFIHSLTDLRLLIDRQGDSITEAAIAELYRNGTIGRHIKKSVKLYRERRDHFCMLLRKKLGNAVSFKIPDGGMSVWTKFNTIDLPTLSEKAALKGLSISDGKLFNTGDINYNSCRMGFASLNLKEQTRAIEILGKIISGF